MMMDVEAAFACFAEKKQIGRTRIDQMSDLLPHIEKALANGYLLFEVLQKASEVIGCTNLTRASLYSLYFRAAKKCGKAQLRQSVSVVPIAPIPTVASDPVAFPAEKAGLRSKAVDAGEDMDDEARAKERERIQKVYSDARAIRIAREKAMEKLKVLGEEAGAWAAQRWPDLADLDENETWTQWLDDEPGRREMVTELARDALRGSANPEVADTKLPDTMLMKFSSNTDASLDKKIFQARMDRLILSQKNRE